MAIGNTAEEEKLTVQMGESDDDTGSTAESATESTAPQTPRTSARKLVDLSRAKGLERQVKAEEFPTNESPFLTFAGWGAGHISRLGIVMPSETDMVETTNELTKRERPETRYWKCPVTFVCGEYQSDTLRLAPMEIPYIPGTQYGTNYVYIQLPYQLKTAFQASVGNRYFLVCDEKNLVKKGQTWWRAINNVDGKFGIVNPTTKEFAVKNIAQIMEKTKKGIEATMVLRFFCKASQTKRQDLTDSTPRTITVEVVHAFITKINVDVLPPARLSKSGGNGEPAPIISRRELADDTLIAEMRALGLSV